MEVLEILSKFNYRNIIVVDNENYFDCTIGKYINETLPIYELLIENYGIDVFNKKICDCDSNLWKLINIYIDNPYEIIDKIKHNVNFKYYSSMLNYKNIDLIEGNTLWFIDIKMDIDNNYNHIKTLYEDFYNRIKNDSKNDIFILFSNQASLYNSLDKLKFFLENKVKLCISDAELNTNILEKRNIDSLLIYSLILKASKNKFFDLLTNSINKSLNKLKDNIFDFEKNFNLFHYDYLTEGKSFDESLFDVFQYELKTNYVNSLNYSIFSIMNNAIDYYLEDKNIDSKEEKVLWRIAKLINDFDNPCVLDDSVNKLHHDISFGDVFNIGKKYYMIANQACDLVIRDSGKRKNSYSILIPVSFELLNDKTMLTYKNEIALSIIKSENLNDENKIIQKVNCLYNLNLNKGKNYTYNLIKIEDQVFNLKFKNNDELLSIPFWCLDNVCCNDDGSINFIYCIDDLRYPLKQRIIKAKSEWEVIKKKTDDKVKDFISLAYLNGMEIDNFKRIGKFNLELANKLYKEFISHQSRVASETIVKLR
ncbi:uncharacterized protein BN742_01327 [Firmicutes bacterium CAG:631]|nr:uncharacterized protein BN742_01327 [Firmicutes bacterium CAG:631]